MRSVVLDGPDSWAQTMAADGIIESFVGLDFTDAETVFERCVTAINSIKKVCSPLACRSNAIPAACLATTSDLRPQEFGELDGVCTFCEMAVPLVSRLAEKFGLPGNTPAAVDAARDKHATRQRMAQCGLPTPRNFLIEQASQIAEAAKLVGFPAGELPLTHSVSGRRYMLLTGALVANLHPADEIKS